MTEIKTASKYLHRVINAQKSGRPAGLMSVCSANRFVLEAAMRQARADDSILCVESTPNQVNQFGGYTGMTPKEFVAFVAKIAEVAGFPRDRILLGGDHIGPGPWRSEPAESALGHARDLVRACILAGYDKLHLDASMACIDDAMDDNHPLPSAIAAERSALLCGAAEETVADLPPERSLPVYVIGTDVPPPGGMRKKEKLPPTSALTDVEYTISATRDCFHTGRLQDAWDRVIALVVQPGIDFGPETVVPYSRERVRKLVSFIKADRRFVYEAHTTDFQTRTALTEMVEDQFTILKVGPALTFAFREALTALASIEEKMLSKKRQVTLSNLPQEIERIMTEDPSPWIKYYPGDNPDAFYLRYYGFSDRVRYYWNRPNIQASVQRLLRNLDNRTIPPPLISQYLPKQYDAICDGVISAVPIDIIHDKIMEVTARYASACRTRI